jgi:hypothetical protein
MERRKANWIGKWKVREEEKEDASSDWMTLRNGENIGNLKKKHNIVPSPDVVLEEAVEISDWLHVGGGGGDGGGRGGGGGGGGDDETTTKESAVGLQI